MRVKGKRGRGASGKTPVFGLLKRNGKVYTQVVKKSNDGIVDYGNKEHFRVIQQ